LIEQGDTTAALKLLGKVPAEARADGDFSERLKGDEEKLSTAADAMLAEVDPLIADQKYAEASAKLQELVKSLNGTPVAAKARQKLNDLMADPAAKAALDGADQTKRPEA